MCWAPLQSTVIAALIWMAEGACLLLKLACCQTGIAFNVDVHRGPVQSAVYYVIMRSLDARTFRGRILSSTELEARQIRIKCVLNVKVYGSSVKLEWADYTSIVWKPIRETSSHATRQGTLVHSRLSLLNHSVCVCVRVRARVRACERKCVCVCALCV